MNDIGAGDLAQLTITLALLVTGLAGLVSVVTEATRPYLTRGLSVPFFLFIGACIASLFAQITVTIWMIVAGNILTLFVVRRIVKALQWRPS